MFARTQWKHLSRGLFIAFCAAAMCMVFSASGIAQRYDKKTTVTFSAPVEVPGVNAQVLPAGTYVFKLLDSMSDRHIVQIFNKDETHVYSTILAIPNYRLKATDKTVMTFSERAAGDPQAIRAWFYPGDTSGQEFVYPKKRAVELAKVYQQPVLYIPDEVAVQPPLVALKAVPVRAVTPVGEDVDLAQVVEAPPVQVARLPKTAGNLPLVALMGLLFTAAGLALNRFRA